MHGNRGGHLQYYGKLAIDMIMRGSQPIEERSVPGFNVFLLALSSNRPAAESTARVQVALRDNKPRDKVRSLRGEQDGNRPAHAVPDYVAMAESQVIEHPRDRLSVVG